MRVRLCAVVGALTLLVPVAGASAKNLFTLDSAPATPGHVVEDGAGNTYVAWVHRAASGADYAKFCKIPVGGTCTSPVSLPIPDGANDITKSVAGAFPALISANTVQVVAPRYVQDDVLLYTSTNGGPFTETTIPSSTTAGAGPYSNKTNPTNVFDAGGAAIAIVANNAGLGFSVAGIGQGNFTFADPGGSVEDSTAGLLGTRFVIAYGTVASGPQNPVFFYSVDTTTGLTDQSHWTGPTKITNGQQPEIASGSTGMYLAENEYPSASASVPTLLTVRKWNGSSFGTPAVLANDKSTGLFDGGTAAETPLGRVVVAWPTARAGDSEKVMRLYVSTNGGGSFPGRVDVARIGDAYATGDNAQLVAGDNGRGLLTFLDSRGLEVADFSAIPAYVPPPYTGPTKAGSASAGKGIKVTIKAPAKCVASSQKFRISAGVKAKHVKGRKVSIKQVVFSLDGHVVKSEKHKPFGVTIKIPTGASHSVHKLKAKITLLIKRRHHKGFTVTRTVTIKVPIC